MSARRADRLPSGRLPLSDAALGRLMVAKANALFRVTHPDPAALLRDLERRPVTVCSLTLPADLAGDET